MADIDYHIFRRQFYIGKQPKIVDETWKSEALPNGLVLSFSNSLPVLQVQDSHNNHFTLLGTAVQSLPDAPAPAAGLRALSNLQDLRELYKSWSGRWVLIANNELHLDATGLLGCFYKEVAGGVEVSSAAGLVSGADVPDTFRLKKQVGADYYPLPDSGFKNVKRLLPTQTLNLLNGTVQFRNLRYELPHLSYNESIAYLCTLLTTTLKNAFAENKDKKLKLALTGGNDSRLLMAALQASQLPYSIFTFHSPNINPFDVRLPKALAKMVGKKYQLIKRKARKGANLEKFNKHTAGHCVENDREYMVYQQFDELEGNRTLLLRGNCFEIGRCFYYKWLPDELADGQAICASQKGNALQAQGWQKWVDWVKQTPQVTMDWRERLYIEGRIAGWLSSTEQALDLVNIERLIPANSFLFYNVVLNMPEEIRLTKAPMIDLIKHLQPQLLQVPINPPVGYYYKQYRRVLFKISKLKQKLNWV